MPFAVKYSIFAIIATIINLATQELSTHIYTWHYYIEASIIAGTITGLVIKYILDKKYIFFYQTQNLSHDTRIFIIYSTMGIFTTVIFWGFEYGFHYAFDTKMMRYIGGILGLMIGYWLKYHLDKKYVFEQG